MAVSNQEINSVNGYAWTYLLEINGLIITFVIKETTNPSVKTLEKGEFEVGKIVKVSSVEGCV
jgi:hypothetical protein